MGALIANHTIECIFSDQPCKAIELAGADYVLAARVSSADFRPVFFVGYKGVANVDFRFYDKANGRILLASSIEAKSDHSASGVGPNEAAQNADLVRKLQGGPGTILLAEAAEEAAKVFQTELGRRIAPPARVIQIRDEGAEARITMGHNYGLRKDTLVEFYEIVDNSDIVARPGYDEKIIGYGKVTKYVDQTEAWVDVSSYRKANVMRGHFVRLAGKERG